MNQCPGVEVPVTTSAVTRRSKESPPTNCGQASPASEEIEKGDYESELRALLVEEYDPETIAEIFPEHTQSRVVGRRDG